MNVLLLGSGKVLPSVSIPTYDLAVALRSQGDRLIGGFHTSLERECLEILLRGSVPVTIIPARTFIAESGRLYSGTLWTAVRAGLTDGRVTIETPPGMVGSRSTKQNAAIRNRILLERASSVLLLYASPGGETDRMVREALDRGLSVSVLDHPANLRWLELGATVHRVPERGTASP